MRIIDHISETDPPGTVRPTRWTRALGTAPLAGAILAAALLAGCGGSSAGAVAHTNASMTAKSASDSTTKPNLLAFARCMRKHGVPNFPDPSGSGGLQLPPGMTTNSPAYRRAANDCKQFIGGETTPKSISQNPQMEEAALKLAKCMRANGVPNFPDGPILKSSGIDENSPTFQRAFQKCNKYLSGSSKVPVTGG